MNRLITRLRPALPEDCPAIYEVHRLSVRYTCLQSYTPEIMQAWLELIKPAAYRDAIADPAKIMQVIEYQGRIRGFFLLDTREAQLDALYVHPFLHHNGLGTALLQRAEKLGIAANLGVLKLYASVNSINFYALNGYEKLGEAVMPFNERISTRCMLMRKFL
nr:GNAT family N-acetyltransferase [uncultured Kingella sp.]